LPEPWPSSARQLLVRLLAAGPGLLEVWETLEETDALDRILPEWQRIRLLPHASPIHRFTVDRHVIETCVEASVLIRRVSRPDVLLVAALLHDIGKGGPVDHSRTGEPIARAIATRLGFETGAVEAIGRLVRWHLLLAEAATTRDPEDPATVALVREALGDAEPVALLRALTEADARATSPKAWTAWRAGLVDDLTRRVLGTFGDQPAAPDVHPALELPPRGAEGLGLDVEPDDDGFRVVVVAPDRVGLLADVAAALALQRAPVRAARAWTEGENAVSVWRVADMPVDAARLRERFAAVVAGRVDPASKLAGKGPTAPAPVVVVRPEASRRSTVLEVRTADRPGVLHLTLAALAALEITVCSAHVDTLGPQAVDVFYLQETGAGALPETRAAEAAHAVRSALDPR
jgi:[protein-PII] uridylyltransferase